MDTDTNIPSGNVYAHIGLYQYTGATGVIYATFVINLTGGIGGGAYSATAQSSLSLPENTNVSGFCRFTNSSVYGSGTDVTVSNEMAMCFYFQELY